MRFPASFALRALLVNNAIGIEWHCGTISREQAQFRDAFWYVGSLCVVAWLATNACSLAHPACLQSPLENVLLFDLGGFGIQTERCLHSLQPPQPKLEITGTFLAGTAKRLRAAETDCSQLLELHRASLHKKKIIKKMEAVC